MQKSLATLKHKDRVIQVASLDDAYRQGYFSGSMTRDEFMQRVLDKNPQMRWHQSSRAAGLFDPCKGEGQKGFICSIGTTTTMPPFTFIKYNPKLDQKLCYSTEHGEITHTEIINMDPDKYKVLARSWRAMFNRIKSLNYEVNDEDLF